MPTNPIRVALPLGIGDAHWSVMKMRALKETHAGRPLHAFINESESHKTVGYLKMIPWIDRAECSKEAPYCITRELPGTYKHDRYQNLRGCRSWHGFDYVLVANHAMESGTPIANWIPELATDYRLEYTHSEETRTRNLILMPEPAILLYPSGDSPNTRFHRDWWTVADWARVVALLNAAGHEPLFVGANTKDDLRYWQKIQRQLGRTRWRSVVGHTSIPDYVLLIERCLAWVGLNSGGGIVSASCETPTVMMWADKRWPVGGAHFLSGMQTAWLNPQRRSHYRAISYGDPTTTPERVAQLALEVAR